MLRLSKKIEYAILAMQYITHNKEKIVSAKEISENLNISFEFLAKTLQKLMKKGFIKSQHGINGGYILSTDPKDISLADIIKALEGNTSIVECFSMHHKNGCGRIDDCTIRHPMKDIQKKINSVFEETTIAELAENGYVS